MAIKKFHKKSPVKNTAKRCLECDKVLTTIDMVYSSDIHYCMNCDAVKQQQKLF